MRHKFNPTAVAGSDGIHTRVSHDRRPNTTGRTPYTFCGKQVIVTDNRVYIKDTGRYIGYFHIDENGHKYVYGPYNKGRLESTNTSSYM